MDNKQVQLHVVSHETKVAQILKLNAKRKKLILIETIGIVIILIIQIILKWDEGTRNARCDANNFHHVLQYVNEAGT